MGQNRLFLRKNIHFLGVMSPCGDYGKPKIWLSGGGKV
jgi:hypothetical protein